MLLDKGFFRIGSEGYAEDNDTYGLATIRKDHVTVTDGVALFDYSAKGSVRRIQEIVDPPVIELVQAAAGAGAAAGPSCWPGRRAGAGAT